MAADQPEQGQPPPESIADVNAVSVFLLWAREHGYQFDSIRVGRVELVNVRDLRPSEQDQVRAAAIADARSKEQGGESLASAFGMPPMPGAQ